MIWIISLIFLIITVWAEYSLWSNEFPRIRSIFWKRTYVWGSLLIWSWTLLMSLLLHIFPNLPDGLYRFYEGTTPVFLFMCAAKVIFAVFAWIGRKTKLRTFFYSVGTMSILVLNCIMTYASTSGRWDIRTERIDMVSERVPDHLDGLRIAVFSDVHTGTLLDRHVILQRMVDRINELDADIVVNCGDLVNKDYTELEPEILEILGGIESRYGVYAAVGNHEMGKYITKPGLTPEDNLQRIVELQESLGWSVLIDETIYLPVEEDTISITGVPFPGELIKKKSHRKLTAHTDYSYLYHDKRAGMFNITISHTPRTWNDILATGRSTLTLSGHVHAFQMKMKLGKYRWSPARLFYKHWSGMYGEDGRYLYVNDGIGYSRIPMRVWTKPEVTLIELRKCE